MNTADFLTISGAIVPDRVALVDDRSSFTYMELQSRVNRLAQAMQALGIGKGKNVGVMAVNSATFVEIYYAAAGLGATLVPLNYRARQEELVYMVGAADVNLLFVAERYLPIYDEIKDTLNVEYVYCIDAEAGGYQSIDQLREGGEDIPVFAEVDDEDATLIIYTSGTTAQPKGVVLTYLSLTALVVNTQAPADPSLDQESILVSVPFYHIAGATTMLSAIFSGRKLVILPQFDPTAWLEAVQDERANVAFVVPTMLKRLMEVENLDSYDLSSLRLITYGAAPMPYQVVRAAVDIFPPKGINLMNAFGQTEATGTISILGPDDHRFDGNDEENAKKDVRLRSVGKPTGDMEVGILSSDGSQLGTDEEGEICIRGDRVMKGYNKRDEETGDALKDGWLHSGDLGKIDEDGYLFITGRIKDMIIRGGENLSPAEIEQVLEDHPAVEDSAVIGVPDEEWGEIIKAILVPSVAGQTADDEALTTYVKTRLASFKAPAEYQWIEEMPRNHLGKILKTELRERYGAPSNGN